MSIKTRTGFYSHDEFENILKVYSKYPLSKLIVHPRIREEFYKGEFIDRIEHVHISDWSADIMEWAKLRPIPHPGGGKIDFDRFFAYLKDNNFDGSITLESPSMLEVGLNAESLQSDLDFIKSRISY